MDWTREGDLTRLHKVFNDPLKSRHERRLAHDNIADDDGAVERITEEIHEYSRRAGYR